MNPQGWGDRVRAEVGAWARGPPAGPSALRSVLGHPTVARGSGLESLTATGRRHAALPPPQGPGGAGGVLSVTTALREFEGAVQTRRCTQAATGRPAWSVSSLLGDEAPRVSGLLWRVFVNTFLFPF